MGRVNLKKIVLNNFRSFQGEHTLDLSSTGLVILRGDSGAGKSNILKALAYAFKFCPHPLKSLSSWNSEEPMSVEVHLETDEGPATLIRGSKKLSLTIAGEEVTGSASAVEERLDRLCGVGKDLREILTYRDQREPKSFLSMDDAEMKEFLTLVLGLNNLEEAIENSKDDLSLKEKQHDSNAQLLEISRNNVQTLPQEPIIEPTVDLAKQINVVQHKIEYLQDKEKEYKQAKQELILKNTKNQQDQASTLKEKSDCLLLEAKSIIIDTSEKDRLSGLVDQCRQHIVVIQEEVNKQIIEYDLETKALNTEARKLHNELAKATNIIDQLEHDRLEVEKLKQDVCAMCERTWDNAKIKLQEKLKEIQKDEELLATTLSHKPRADELDNLLKTRKLVIDPRLDQLKTVLANLNQQIAVEDQKIANIKALTLAEAHKKIAELKASTIPIIDPNVEKATCLYDETIKELNSNLMVKKGLEGQLSLLIQKNKNLVDNYKNEKNRAQSTLRTLENAEKAFNLSQKAFNKESDYLDLLKGFKSKIFDEVLEEVSTEATEIIGNLENASHISIEFKSSKETNKGTVKDVITPVIYLHGEEHSLKESVSGGQFTSVELAVDLALSKVISRRLACSLNWIILDESFEGHDTATKQSCLEMLQKYASDKLVIVVDHASETKELFTQSINVKMKDKSSYIEE